MKRKDAGVIGDIRRCIRKRNAVSGSLRRCEFACGRKIAHGSGQPNIRRNIAFVRRIFENFPHGKILCPHIEIEIRLFRVKADRSVDARSFPLCLRCRRDVEFSLVKVQCRAPERCFRPIEQRRPFQPVRASI